MMIGKALNTNLLIDYCFELYALWAKGPITNSEEAGLVLNCIFRALNRIDEKRAHEVFTEAAKRMI